MQRNKTWFPRSLWSLERKLSTYTTDCTTWRNLRGAEWHEAQRLERGSGQGGRVEEVMPELDFEGYSEFQQMNVDFLNKDTVARHI